MLKVSGNDIYLTRGDTAIIEVQVMADCNKPYEPEDGDRLKLTIKKGIDDAQGIIIKEIDQLLPGGGAEIAFAPADTEKLVFGRYVYDVELLKVDGAIHTIIEPSSFWICEEVG